MTEQVTETGIDISNFAAELAAGTVSITKPIPASGNYFYIRAKFRAVIQNGAAVMVEDAPEVRNINRQSIVDMRTKLAEQEAAIVSAKAQLSAIEAEMAKRVRVSKSCTSS